MSIAELNSHAADTTADLLPALAERWSPRAFDAAAEIDEAKLHAALEAARWSPSASNSQPWRFVVARRGSAAFDTIAENLLGFNKVWAGSASVLVLAIAEVIDAEGNPRRFATYDLGQAVAHLTIQAHHDGLHAHQMGGIEADALRVAFGFDERFQPISVTALGMLGDPDALPERLRERELAPRTRNALADIVVVNS
ncbi:nitroreductase family protein [Leifsonia sp. NPDC058292]|uniref:nitroreductase family protein n=1 Tax=Leifsonia sp. NPDC058292 TaxID=3346428 RepID=UPI0036D958BE